jgi:hypothetical protein
MGLNDQVNKTMRQGDGGFNIFQKHVKALRLGGDIPILFRIEPAFNPGEPNARVSWLPFRFPNQELTDWGKFINISPMVGRGGPGYGVRKDLVSLKTFDPSADCPLEVLYGYIRENAQEWGYLVAESQDKTQRAVFRRPGDVFLCNILTLDHPEKGTQLAVISRGASKSLMSPDGGLVYQVAANSVGGDNYLAQWACGDLTDPNNGPVLRYYKVNEKKGQMNTGRIEMHITQQGVMRRPLTQELLAQRIDFSQPADTYMTKVTAESLIADLIELLNGRSPITGQHERVLLRQAFPQFRIPEPPVTSVQMPGMVYQQPVQGGVPAYQQPQLPAAGAGQQIPVQHYQQPVQGGGILQDNLPGLGLGGGTAIPSGAPIQQAPVQGGILQAAPVGAGSAIPGSPLPTMNNVPLPTGGAVAGTGAPAPSVPGDAIDTSKFNKEEWLQRLKAGQKG